MDVVDGDSEDDPTGHGEEEENLPCLEPVTHSVPEWGGQILYDGSDTDQETGLEGIHCNTFEEDRK